MKSCKVEVTTGGPGGHHLRQNIANSSYGKVDNLSTKRVPSPKIFSLRLFVPTSCFPFFKKYKDLKTVQFLLFVYKISHLNIHLTATGERQARIHMQRGADWWSGIFKLKGFALRSEYFQSQDIKHNLPLCQRRIINACEFSLKTGCDALTQVLLKN